MPIKKQYRAKQAHYKEYQKKWARKNKAKVNARCREAHKRNRESAIAQYGGKCACCGETQYEFLAIDHIKGGGTKERKEKFPNSQSFYIYLKSHYEPDKYRVLCHNCNSAIAFYGGKCPHGLDNGVKLAVAFYDLHYPLVHWPTFNAAMDFIRRNKVDMFIFGGDQFNNDCISHHTKNKPGLRLPGAFRKEEAGFKTKILEPIEKELSSSCKKVWLTGNHDAWVDQLVEEQPELDGIQREKSLPLSNWQVIPFGQSFRQGKLTFVHGEAATGTGNQGSIMHSKKMVEMFCTNVVYGHLHSPQSFTKVLPFNEKEKWQSYCLPILGKTNPAYLHNRPTAWLNGFGIIEYMPTGNFNVYSIVVSGGQFVFGGRIYGASRS